MSDPQKTWTVPMLAQARAEGRKLVMLTSYDASFARVLDDNGVDLILVGDSLGMVVQGHDSTLPVQVGDIAYHVAAVARGARRAPSVEQMLAGATLTDERIQQAAEAAAQTADVVEDFRASAAFRAQMLGVYARRVLVACAKRRDE